MRPPTPIKTSSALHARRYRRPALAALAALAALLLAAVLVGPWAGSPGGARGQAAVGCSDPRPEWLMCEDFEGGAAGWEDWFAGSPFVECLGCRDGGNNPDRLLLVEDRAAAHSGSWSLHMPAEAGAGYQGAALTFRDCRGEKRQGCRLNGHDQLYFRSWVRLADDHAYVHHFLSLAGTQPDAYWAADGNAGCRPNGTRWAGTTLDFDADRALFFYTYFPGMRCDRGGYCSGDYARRICEGCAAKDMPCRSGPECCWGNHFGPAEPVRLERGRWVCLELMARFNTPGEADGEMAFWVDDQPAHRQTGMHWRDVAALQLNQAWLQHYIAAGDTQVSNRIWFDDVVVSTERIGCGPRRPDATATTTAEATATGGPASATPTVGTAPANTVTPQATTPTGTTGRLFLPLASRGH